MKLSVVGSALVLESTLKAKDLELISFFKPEALKIIDEETKSELFKVAFKEGTDYIGNIGITFGTAKRSDNSLQVTVAAPVTKDEAKLKDEIIKKYAVALQYLAMLEATLPEIVEEVVTLNEKLAENITID